MHAEFIDSGHLEGRPGRGDDAIEHARKGGVVVFRDCLNAIGFGERLGELTLEEMRLHCSPEQVDRVAREGFEHLHEILDPQQIYDVNVGLTERLRPEAARLIGEFASKVLGYRRRVFVFGLPVVRFFVPHDAYAANRDLYGRRQGFLQIQGPHHDTWFDHATESLNVWIALGPVRRGNGLIVYPDHWGNYLRHDGTRRMPKSQPLGRSVNFDLQPGDVVFFHGETLHSSELNVTGETRYVLTNRFTLEKPRFKEHQQWHTWYDSSLLGTPMERFAEWPTYLSTGFVRYSLRDTKLIRAVRKARRKAAALVSRRGASPAEAPGHTPSAPAARPSESAPSPATVAEEMAVGEIRAISKNRCLLKTEDGLVSFGRFCTHEGADLAHATYEHGRIRCPWHNLSFDAKTGEQPCQSLKDLKVEPVADPASIPGLVEQGERLHASR